MTSVASNQRRDAALK